MSQPYDVIVVDRARWRDLGLMRPFEVSLWKIHMTSAETAKERLRFIVKRDREQCPCWVWQRVHILKRAYQFGGKPIFRLKLRN